MKEYWFPFYPTIFRKATRHLSAEQDGIYRRLIDEYMESGEPLPDSNPALSRIAGVSLEIFENAADVIKAFFRCEDGFLYHDFCNEQLDIQDKKSRKRSNDSKKAALKRWGNKKKPKMPKSCDDDAKHVFENATRQDRTGQDRTKERKKENINSHTSTPDPRARETEPPALGVGVGVLKNSGEQEEKIPSAQPFKVESVLTDAGLKAAKTAAPGHDIYHLMQVYDEGVNSGKRQRPNKPDRAFPAWCWSYAKGAENNGFRGKSLPENDDGAPAKPRDLPPEQPWHEAARKVVGNAVFNSWLRPLTIEGGVVLCPTKFIQDYVLSNYAGVIRQAAGLGIEAGFKVRA
jgi:uncharacterized protein YdaU (DUF1376 family)